MRVFAMILVLAVLFIAACLVTSLFTSRQYRARSAALAECARSLGLEHSSDGSLKILDRHFDLVRKGASPGKDMIWGLWRGLPVSYVEYYQLTAGPVYARFDSPVACATLNIEVPYLMVRRKGGLRKLAKRSRNLTCDSFSERFTHGLLVKSEDSGFAEKLIDTDMMAWLLSSDAELVFEVSGRRLAAHEFPSIDLPHSTDLLPRMFDALVEFTAHRPS